MKVEASSVLAPVPTLAGSGVLPRIVLDTNIVLDLFVFTDPATQRLASLLERGALRWIAAPAMRSELARVLTYPHIAARLQVGANTANAVLAQFDARVTLVAAATKSAFTCKDADDQQFIDLALAHQALLLSRDRAVLCMARRLRSLGVQVATCWDALVVPAVPAPEQAGQPNPGA